MKYVRVKFKDQLLYDGPEEKFDGFHSDENHPPTYSHTDGNDYVLIGINQLNAQGLETPEVVEYLVIKDW